MRPRDVFTAVPKTRAFRPYRDPVVTVAPSGKGHLSCVADELLGSPNEIVALNDGNGAWAIRAATADDPEGIRRCLDVDGSVSLGMVPAGSYILEGQGTVFVLKPCDRAKLQRKTVRRPTDRRGKAD